MDKKIICVEDFPEARINADARINDDAIITYNNEAVTRYNGEPFKCTEYDENDIIKNDVIT